jgi:hypothetical protein
MLKKKEAELSQVTPEMIIENLGFYGLKPPFLCLSVLLAKRRNHLCLFFVVLQVVKNAEAKLALCKLAV